MLDLARAAVHKLALRGITRNAVAPGFVLTELTKDLPQAVQGQIVAQTLVGRFGTTEEIAKAFAFLASDEAAPLRARSSRWTAW